MQDETLTQLHDDLWVASRPLRRVMAWDFDRVTLAHGEVLETGGKEAMASAFAYLLDG